MDLINEELKGPIIGDKRNDRIRTYNHFVRNFDNPKGLSYLVNDELTIFTTETMQLRMELQKGRTFSEKEYDAMFNVSKRFKDEKLLEEYKKEIYEKVDGNFTLKGGEEYIKQYIKNHTIKNVNDLNQIYLITLRSFEKSENNKFYDDVLVKIEDFVNLSNEIFKIIEEKKTGFIISEHSGW